MTLQSRQCGYSVVFPPELKWLRGDKYSIDVKMTGYALESGGTKLLPQAGTQLQVFVIRVSDSILL